MSSQGAVRRRRADREGQPRLARGEQGAGGDAVPAALHGSAGHHLRPAQGAAADVQRHGRDGDHVLGPDERPPAVEQHASTPQFRVRRTASGRSTAASSTARFPSTAGRCPKNTTRRPGPAVPADRRLGQRRRVEGCHPGRLPGPQGHGRPTRTRHTPRRPRTPSPTYRRRSPIPTSRPSAATSPRSSARSSMAASRRGRHPADAGRSPREILREAVVGPVRPRREVGHAQTRVRGPDRTRV